jgi:hypothetical protein
MMKFSFETILSPASMGQMSAGILAEMFKRNLMPAVFPIGNIDLSQFNAPEGFGQWLEFCIKQANLRFKRDEPSLRYFHIMGSHAAIGDRSRLYTVHETNRLTDTEINILKRHDSVMVPSAYNQEVFAKYGIEAGIAPNFYDERHIYKIDTKKEDYVTWGLIGKLENRKHTARIIDAWCTKFGGNKDHRLNLNIFNMHLFNEFPMDQRLAVHKQKIQEALKYELPWNVNFLPFLSQQELNKCYNKISIDLSGLSGGEGMNLPFLNTRCLGLKGISLNAHSHKDYATAENSILVEPAGMMDAADGFFYRHENPYNQGQIYTWNKEEVLAAMDRALYASEPDSAESEKLKQKYSVKNCVDALIKNL